LRTKCALTQTLQAAPALVSTATLCALQVGTIPLLSPTPRQRLFLTPCLTALLRVRNLLLLVLLHPGNQLTAARLRYGHIQGRS